VALLVASGAAGMLPVSLNCPLPLISYRVYCRFEAKDEKCLERCWWWIPTRTTTNWPLIILGLSPYPFSRIERMPINVPRYIHLDLSKHVTRILWKLRQQRGLKMFLAYVTNVLVKIKMFRTKCMLFLFYQDHRVCELRKYFPLFTPFFEDFSAAQPFLLQQVNNQLVHNVLSQQNTRLFELTNLFVAGRDQSAADQPNNLAEGHPP